MHSSDSLEAPTRRRAVRFWLVSIGLGTLLIAVTMAEGQGPFTPIGFCIYVGVTAALFSLPALLFLPFFIRWAVGGVSSGQRYLRLLAAQSSSASIVAVCIFVIFQQDTFFSDASDILKIGAAYYVAGLVAAYLLYRSWL